jgi:hypothetical protein
VHHCVGAWPEQVELNLQTPWRDGTTHLVMSPLEFMQRLAALVPRARLERQWLFRGDKSRRSDDCVRSATAARRLGFTAFKATLDKSQVSAAPYPLT